MLVHVLTSWMIGPRAAPQCTGNAAVCTPPGLLMATPPSTRDLVQQSGSLTSTCVASELPDDGRVRGAGRSGPRAAASARGHCVERAAVRAAPGCRGRCRAGGHAAPGCAPVRTRTTFVSLSLCFGVTTMPSAITISRSFPNALETSPCITSLAAAAVIFS